jgi:polyribonucleotide nucleotidyltransferase
VVGAKSPSAADWFPLTVDYVEKTYAAARSRRFFFKREAGPPRRRP